MKKILSIAMTLLLLLSAGVMAGAEAPDLGDINVSTQDTYPGEMTGPGEEKVGMESDPYEEAATEVSTEKEADDGYSTYILIAVVISVAVIAAGVIVRIGEKKVRIQRADKTDETGEASSGNKETDNRDGNPAEDTE